MMKKRTAGYFSTQLLCCLLVCVLSVSVSTPCAAQAEAKEKQQSGRAPAMTETANPNIGKRFPEVKDDSLANTPVTLPDSARGKVTLITVAFLRESQSQLDSWLNPFFEKYGSNPKYTFYEVPMLSRGYKFMRFMIDGGMRAGIPQAKHKNVVTMYGDIEKYMKELRLDLRYGYAFLLDREGIIRWQGQGYATPEARKELFDLSEKLAK
jgi:hypothetical protein